jgi:competence protein ComFC
MNYCLWCHQSFSQPVTWSFVLGIQYNQSVCSSCFDKLHPIVGEICQICGRGLSIFPEKYQQNGICIDCLKWENDERWSGILTKNRSLYQYNDFLQEILAKYKFRGDAAIVEGFRNKLITLYNIEYKYHIVVPIPLSHTRHYDRGFNQSELIAELLGKTLHNVLIRSRGEVKQSKKSRTERINITENIFAIKKSEMIELKNKPILLVDDIYTTGATVRQAAKLMIKQGVKSVSSLTIARS